MATSEGKKTPGETLARAVQSGKLEGIVPSDIHVELSATGGTVTLKQPEPQEASAVEATQG